MQSSGRDLERELPTLIFRGLLSVDLKPAGALPSSAGRGRRLSCGSQACGQAIEQSPHWMQILGSQTGMSWRPTCFSHRGAGGAGAVDRHADGQKVAPAGDHRRPATRLDEVGGAGSGPAATLHACRGGLAGTFTSCTGERVVDRREILFDNLRSPFLPVVFSSMFLICAIASPPVAPLSIAKKQVCMIVLFARTMPMSLATFKR